MDQVKAYQNKHSKYIKTLGNIVKGIFILFFSLALIDIDTTEAVHHVVAANSANK